MVISKIAQHVYEHDHSMDFENITIVDKVRNYNQRLFLEAWFSLRDPTVDLRLNPQHILVPREAPLS